MSYDIYLEAEDGSRINLEAAHGLTGGTYQLGGTRRAWLNVTYNYAEHFQRVFGEKGIRSIYGLRAQDSIPVLEAAAQKLDTDVSEDYWEPTEGNARAALEDLVALARLAPQGVWNGD